MSEIQLGIDLNTMYFTWTIPNVSTTTAKIKIVYDYSGTTQEAISDAFTISGTTYAIDVETTPGLSFNNYPIPFNQKTNFLVNLENKENVLLELYSVNGMKLETILNREMLPGEHKIPWQAINYSNGIYFCKMKVGKNITTNKLMVLD